MKWLWIVTAVLLVFDALRVRGRARALATLAPSDEPISPDHRFIVASGVTLDEATRRAASAYARAKGLALLDIVPARTSALRAWGFLQFVDPAKYKDDRIGRGATAQHAMLVTTE